MRLLAAVIVLAAVVTWRTAAASSTPEREVLEAEAAWSRAIASNDSAAVARFTDPAWMIVAADGTTSRERFLAVIASHDLVHDHMDLAPDTVRVYGDVALVSGIATSKGAWQGKPFETRERSTDVFVKANGQWRCVFTQLTPSTAK